MAVQLADAQHLAAELLVDFDLALIEDLFQLSPSSGTSTMTLVENDYDFSDLFKRNLDAIAKK